MARYRLTRPAERDIALILKHSEQAHGKDARYRACLTAAMRRIAVSPNDPVSMDRAELLEGLRSFHIRHSRREARAIPVSNPVHIIFYRATPSGVVDIHRVLHDQMDPSLHMGTPARP